MGAGIAQVCATFEHAVLLNDIGDEYIRRGVESVAKNLDRDVKKEKITDHDKAVILGRIRPQSSLTEGLDDVDLAIEAATENVKLKLDLFKTLDSSLQS